MGMQIYQPNNKTSVLAAEGLTQLKMATPPSMGSKKKVSATEHGSANFDILNTLREIRVTILIQHPLQALENKGPQKKWSWSIGGQSMNLRSG